MLTSKMSPSTRFYWLRVFVVLVVVTVFCLWFNQKSIETYWLQRYSKNSPLIHLQHYSWWRSSDKVRRALCNCELPEDARVSSSVVVKGDSTSSNSEEIQGIEEKIETRQLSMTEKLKARDYLKKFKVDLRRSVLPNAKAMTHRRKKQAAKKIAAKKEDIQVKKANNPSSLEKIILNSDDYVVFLGDSMMQSLAPTMQRWLKKNYNIDSNNLGRHSTGLTKQDYYDWPAKAESIMNKYDNLGLVIVFLGANDPWPILTKKRYEFNSDDWRKMYSERMLRIVDAAHEKNAQVIWVGLPYMRIPKYNKKIVQMDDLMRETLKDKAIYIPIRKILSGGEDKYRHSIKIGKKWRRVRQKDGIHMNVHGNAAILEAIKPFLSLTRTERTARGSAEKNKAAKK